MTLVHIPVFIPVGTAAAVPPPFRHGEPALCCSHPI